MARILFATWDGGGNVPPACLTSEQVTTMQRHYAGTTDPVNGQLINPGFPARQRD